MVELDGETVTEDPLPMEEPPQLPEYHCQLAPVPREPPLTVSVVGDPEQTVAGEADAEEGADETEFTVTVVLAQVVVLQVPEART